MRSPFYFIVKPKGGKRYENTKQISGIDFIISTSEEDHRFSNREGIVMEIPLGYDGPIQKGDTLLVHHNAFKFYNDMHGNQKSGKSFFKDDLFFIEHDQYFLYKHDGQWHTHSRFCFVKPIAPRDSLMKKFTKEEPLMGTMRYINKTLLDAGVHEGDTVCFVPDCEYEFNVDGEKLYRIFDHQITMTL